MLKRKQHLILLAVALIAVAGAIYYTSSYDRDDEIPAGTMAELEGRTKDFV